MMRRLLMIGLGAALSISAVGADETSAKPAGDLGFLHIELPAGEKSYLTLPEYPTARIWRFQNTHDVGIQTTRNSVGPDSAMVIFTEKGVESGEVLAYDIGVHGEDLKSFAGISFWMRGDGGNGDLSIGTNWNQQTPTNARVGKFPLSQTAWQKHFVPWSKFSSDVSTSGFYFLNLKLEPATPRQAWEVIARVNLYKSEVTEPIQPVSEADPAGMISAEQFLSPVASEAAAMVPKTLAKLKAGRPVTIVAYGDSITAGAQLWHKNPENKGNSESEKCIYTAVLERRLAQHYHYANHRAVLKSLQGEGDKAAMKLAGDLKPSADGSLPFDGLQVIAVGAGGKNTQFGYEHLAEATQLKPDLVVWFFGANDLLGKDTKSYQTYSQQAIAELKKQGVEVILCRPTFFVREPYYANALAFAAPAAEVAKLNGIPMADMFGAFHARGRRYLGDLLSDDVHPNEYGHEIMGSVLAAALGVPDQLVWEQPLFRVMASEKTAIPAAGR